MKILSEALIALVAIEHIYILWLEMFAWETRGKKVFRSLKPELFAPTRVLAANQGLYNGFLAVGLLWGAIRVSRDFMIFFLLCVIAAGVYGGLTAKLSILYIQAIPGLVALLAVLAARRTSPA